MHSRHGERGCLNIAGAPVLGVGAGTWLAVAHSNGLVRVVGPEPERLHHGGLDGLGQAAGVLLRVGVTVL